MNELVNLLSFHNIILKSLHSIKRSTLNTRKKIDIFNGVDLKSNYISIYYFHQKSRFIGSHYRDLQALHAKNEEISGHKINKGIVILNTALCSKVEKNLKANNWKILHAAL